jgi:bifunctional non-homologous end joining protein LigD
LDLCTKTRWHALLAVVASDNAQLFSHNGRNITDTFPAIAKALLTQKDNLVLDGEIIAFNEEGSVDFDNLQSRWMIKDPIKAAQQDQYNPTAFYAFDLIRLNDESIAN